MKILSVDDKVENLYLLEAMLKGAGYQVVSAHNGIEALQHLGQDKFDLIISDILMPQLDGFELCHRVKQSPDLRHIPFVFYTATYTEKKDEELGLRLGASRFILKPVEPEQFLAILRQVIQEYEAGRLASLPPTPAEKEEVLLKAYNLRLVQKLDRKVQQLEQASQKLQAAMEEKERELVARRTAEAALRQARDDLVKANAELERKVEERTAELFEANTNLQTFIYHAAHDMSSPLRAIHAFSILTMEDYGEKFGPEGRSLLERIVLSAAQMQRLLSELLEYSKISRAELKLERMDLKQAVNEALALLTEDIRIKNASVTVTGPLPKVVGHLATVVLLINNLVSNALKFIAPEVQPEVRIWAEERNTGQGSVVRLSVADNGIGIAPEHLQKIFGAFERLHGKNTYPGTGLGLAIVRKGAERIGGRVGVESELGKGSRFWLELAEAEG